MDGPPAAPPNAAGIVPPRDAGLNRSIGSGWIPKKTPIKNSFETRYREIPSIDFGNRLNFRNYE